MTRLIADVVTWPAEHPALIGSQCSECAAVTFPAQGRCPRCGQKSMAELELPSRGRLVSWTTQGFPPIVPYAGDETGRSFEPFGVGLVQLGDLIRVESRLTENDPERLDFDMEVELRVVPFYVDGDGEQVMTFAFEPVASTTQD